MSTTIRLATPGDKQAWDAYVYLHPKASPYQLFAWREAVENTYGHNSSYLIAKTYGNVSGIFPLILFKIPLVSKKLISLPFCDVGDVLADNEEVYKDLFEKAISMIGEKGVRGLEVRTARELPLSIEEKSVLRPVKNDKVRMLLKLPPNSEELWKGFKSKLRSQVRKAKKNGLIFKWGTSDDIDDFYSVFRKNMHDLGSPVHSKKWIKEILRRYVSNAKMGLIYNGNDPIGCGLILCTQHTASIPWASTLREFNRLSPNMLLYWEFLKYASDNGKNQFDFGRSTVDEGTYRFKKQWGGFPEKLYWYKLKNEQMNVETSGKKRKVIEDAWRRLPTPAVNLIGPVARKFIDL